MRVERARKPAKCPSCGAAPVASILYGLPVFDEELEQAIAVGRIALGGCCQEIDAPTWICTHCRLEIFRTKKASGGVG